MGCFLVCFKGSKDRKRCRKSKKSFPVNKEKESCFAYVNSISSGIEIVSETKASTDNTHSELRENREQGTLANARKKVTFDLHVTTFEIVPVQEDAKFFTEDDEIERDVREEKDKEEEGSNDEPKLYPPNHRYQDCESSDCDSSDEEDEGLYEDEEIDFDEGNCIGINGDEEESYDSYFSLSMESENKHFSEVSNPKPTIEPNTERELVVSAKANVRDRSRYIHPVLNPVENLSHWKEVKVRPTFLKNLSKENFDIKSKPFISQDPAFAKTEKLNKPISSNPNPHDFGKEEIAVDSSLSSWLVSPNNSSTELQKSNSMLSRSSISQEERPILGALTMEDIKHASRTSSPRRSSPSRSPEEDPIVGTVGGYWSSKSKEDSASSWNSSSEKRGIPNTTNKYREDKTVNLFYTPFEARLERALNMESSKICSNVESVA